MKNHRYIQRLNGFVLQPAAAAAVDDDVFGLISD